MIGVLVGEQLVGIGSARLNLDIRHGFLAELSCCPGKDQLQSLKRARAPSLRAGVGGTVVVDELVVLPEPGWEAWAG